MPRFWVTVHEVRCFDVAVEVENKKDARSKAVAFVMSEPCTPDYVSVDPINVFETEISDAELKCFEPKKEKVHDGWAKARWGG